MATLKDYLTTSKKDKNKQQTMNTRVLASGLYPPKAYAETHVYLMDDVDPNTPKRMIGKRAKMDPHQFKCEIMYDFFHDHTDCKVHSVRFDANATKDTVFDYWRAELRDKTSRDLLIIFFHGEAFGEEKSYTWTLSQHPKVQINAYELINMINESNCDCLFLLDCFIHTRITNKWTRETGNTEIIARPERMCTSEGKIAGHDSEFTEAIAANLDSYVLQIRDAFKKQKKMKSIPDIMARDKEMYSNPQRIWMSRTRFGHEDVVTRFKVDPLKIRATGKLEFYLVQIQGEQQTSTGGYQVAANAVEVHERQDIQDEDSAEEDQGDDLGDINGDSLFMKP